MLPLIRSRSSILVACGFSSQTGTDVAGDTRLDFSQHRYGRADLPRCAVAALVAIMLDESCLHGM